MTLSVIVVSYNVKGYLSLCLDSVLEAIGRLPSGTVEVFVFDDASSMDQQIGYLFITPRFRLFGPMRTSGSALETMRPSVNRRGTGS